MVMKNIWLMPTLLGSAAWCVESFPQYRAARPAAFFLAGDSTTAKQIEVNGGGWGNGFLGTLRNGATGINYGHNGATTKSFVDRGDWAIVLAAVKKATTYSPYVTISFGHNDQKTTSGITLAQYTANLKSLGLDVRAAGGEPIYVTSVSRRNYDSSNRIKEDLAAQANATIFVAKSLGAVYADLNRVSTDYLNAIGPENGHKYNLNPDDNTHINKAGSVLFGNIVSDLLLEGPGSKKFKQWTGSNATIVRDIKAGVFILPDV